MSSTPERSFSGYSGIPDGSGKTPEYFERTTEPHIPDSVQQLLYGILSSRDIVLGNLTARGAPSIELMASHMDLLEMRAELQALPTQSIFKTNLSGVGPLSSTYNEALSLVKPWYVMRLSRAIGGKERQIQGEGTHVGVIEGARMKGGFLSRLFGGGRG